jgi:hypothetical protein
MAARAITSYPWRDQEGKLHISVPALLAALHYPDTPADREHIHRTIIDVMAVEYPGITVVHEHDEVPPV